MSPDAIASAIAKGITAGNTITNNLLFGIVAIALVILIIVLFSSVKMNSTLTRFIMDMSTRSTEANELSGEVGESNRASLSDIATGQDAIGGDVKLMLTLSRWTGDKIVTLAKYAIEPTAQGKIDVKEIAEDIHKEKSDEPLS